MTTQKVNSGIAWSENKPSKLKRSIQGTSWWLPSQEWGRDLFLSRATGPPYEMFEASWCVRAIWSHTGHASILSTHLMLSRFLLVLKMSVLDIIRLTASFFKCLISSVFGEQKTRLRAIVSRGGPWERLALTQRTLGRVSEINQCLGSLPTRKILNTVFLRLTALGAY